MSGMFPPKVVAAGEGKTVAEILSPAGLEEYFEKLAPILAAHRPAAEYYQLAEDYGITIQDDWIEELERTYGIKL